MARKTLLTGNILSEYDVVRTLVVNPGTGTAALQVESATGVYATFRTYELLTSELLPLQDGINYKILLTGDATAFLSQNR